MNATDEAENQPPLSNVVEIKEEEEGGGLSDSSAMMPKNQSQLVPNIGNRGLDIFFHSF